MYQKIADLIGRMTIAEPDKLDLMILVPALIFFTLIFWLFRILNRAKQTDGSRYSVLGVFKFWGLLICLLVLVILALARPYVPDSNFIVRRGNVEVIFIVDYSSSMFLKDTVWPRIDIAVREITNLLSTEIIRDGDRAALFVFGSDASRRLPMTKDLNLFASEVDLIGYPNTLIGDSIYWSSDVAGAFHRTYILMDRQDMIAEFGKEIENWQPKPKQNRLILIFTDGGDLFVPSEDKDRDKNQELNLDKAIKELNRRNLKIYPVGIGTKSGALMTDILKDYKPDQYDPRLKEDLKGIVSRLNVRSLEYLKNTTDSLGPFLIENEKASAVNFIRTAINQHRSTIIEPVKSDEKEELWMNILLAALAVFMIGLWVTKFK